MNYKILLVSLIITFPTFMGVIGSIDHVDSFFLVFNFIFLSVCVFICSLFICKKTYKLSKDNIDFEISKKTYILLYIIYGYIIIVLFKYALLHNFNFSLIRNNLVRDQGIISLLYDGNVYYRMLFEYIIGAVTISLFFFKSKWDRWQLILLLLFVLSDFLLGGRFAIYKTIIIIIIGLLNYKSNISIKKISIIVTSFILIAIGIQANRYVNGYDANLSLFINNFLNSLYLYHSVQPAIIFDNLNSSPQFGMFTGLMTPFYMIFGLKSAEGNISEELFRTVFTIGDNSFNAFGTSAIYFTTSYGIIGVSIYAISIIFLSIFTVAISNEYKTIILLRFILFSFYMSMFMPYIWTFSWYITFIIIITCVLFFRRRVV